MPMTLAGDWPRTRLGRVACQARHGSSDKNLDGAGRARSGAGLVVLRQLHQGVERAAGDLAQ